MCLVFPGIPGVYFHNLFGTENWLEGYLSTNHNRDINRRMFSYDEIKDFIKKPNFENRVFEKTTEMLKIRKENEIFHPDAEFIPLPTSDNLWVVERRWKNKKALFIHNLTHQTQTYEGIKLQAYEHLWQLN
jgi:sucrose phosphorylase